MSKLKHGYDAEANQFNVDNLDSLSPDERRKYQRDTIIVKLRRYLRIGCIVGAAGVWASSFFGIGQKVPDSFVTATMGSIAIGCVAYFAGLCFLRFGIGPVIKLYYYIRDLATRNDTVL